VCRVPPIAGPNPVPFRANRGNIALIWSFLNHIDFALIQPRQTGKSVSTDCLMVWLHYIATTNTKISLITKDDALRTENVDRLKNIRNCLPPYLWVLDKTDAKNSIGLTYNTKNNKYMTGVAQSSEANALNLGRGQTAPIFHFDEPPFVSHIGTTLPAALAAGTAAREEAKLHGMPYGNIFTTTAGKKDDRDGKYMYDMIHGGSPWTEHFFDCSDTNALYILVKKSCRGSEAAGNKVIINGTFSHLQLGKTDEWLMEALSNANSVGEAADRDFFNRWTSGTQSSPLSPTLNGIIHDSEMEPLHREISKDSYMFNWYIPESEIMERMANGHYILGMDTSDAIGRDGIGMVLIDVRDLSVVGAGSINETNLLLFARYIASFLIKYLNVTLVIERKSSAQTFIDCLLIELPAAGIDPFKRVYNKVVDEAQVRKSEYAEICQDISSRHYDFYTPFKKSFGFVTTGNSRDTLFSNVLQNSAKNAGHLVKDKAISNEIRGLVVKNGRVDHRNSGNDDMAFSWLLAQWLLTNGNNLHHYGIDMTECMSLVGANNREINAAEVEGRKHQVELRKRIEDLHTLLKVTTSGFQIAKIEQQLKSLTRQTRSDGGKVFNIDALLKEAHDARVIDKRDSRRATPIIDVSSLW